MRKTIGKINHFTTTYTPHAALNNSRCLLAFSSAAASAQVQLSRARTHLRKASKLQPTLRSIHGKRRDFPARERAFSENLGRLRKFEKRNLIRGKTRFREFESRNTVRHSIHRRRGCLILSSWKLMVDWIIFARFIDGAKLTRVYYGRLLIFDSCTCAYGISIHQFITQLTDRNDKIWNALKLIIGLLL